MLAALHAQCLPGGLRHINVSSDNERNMVNWGKGSKNGKRFLEGASLGATKGKGCQVSVRQKSVAYDYGTALRS